MFDGIDLLDLKVNFGLSFQPFFEEIKSLKFEVTSKNELLSHQIKLVYCKI